MKIKEILGIKENKKKKKNNRLIAILTIFFIFVVLFLIGGASSLAYQYIYKDKIYYGVEIDGISFGGLGKEAAREKINQLADNLKARGLNFYYKNEKFVVDFNVISPVDPDLAYNILSFDAEATANRAFKFGRSGSVALDVLDQVFALFRKQELRPSFILNEEELSKILRDKFKSYDKPGKNATLKFLPSGEITIEPESYGVSIDYDAVISELKSSVNLNFINDFKLKTKLDSPTVSKSEAEQVLPEVKSYLAFEKIDLTYQGKKWVIYNDELKTLLAFVKKNNNTTLAFNRETLLQKLDSIGQSINVEAQDARFVMADNKVVEFTPAVSGIQLDTAASADKLDDDFFNNKKTEIELVAKESEPKVKTADSNNLGIRELIGAGVSDFSGSHVNRIKNIKNAVNHLNGILIPPGEFSIVEAIGEVNAATGYFPEFVIKGDRTIPEFGGGLCQIGTTMFRVALYSGLPITERRPHSYIVSYYSPLGMDATIYGPHPDLRFINDTENYILLRIKIEGTKLTFEFWGTGDGRKVEITNPVLYNWTAQPPDKLVENPKLKPGDKKLAESGRRGADAYFYRYITSPSGEKKEEVWRSHYQPWPNIYEVGPVVESVASPEVSVAAPEIKN
ncbi:MAG: VanW family protein [Patescibacteria group bacterium]|nr:VanW family protein [Patescibacteria group bacterium]